MYKKIKNIKYSPSKSKEKTLNVELKIRRNKMLSDSDWVHMNDVQLTNVTKAKWGHWRNRLRTFDSSDLSNEEYKEFLDIMEERRRELLLNTIPNETPEQLQSNLTKMLYKVHNEFLLTHKNPTTESRYSECLDILADYMAENDITLDASSIDMIELIKAVNAFDTIDSDISRYPFVNTSKTLHNVTVNDIIIDTLTEKMEYFNLSLQAEWDMINFIHAISTCNDIEHANELRLEILGTYEY
jgi:hypothetical protein